MGGWDAPASASPLEYHRQSQSTSAVLANARNTLPHPLARAVHALQRAHTPRDQYEALLDAAETLAITVSVTSAALLQGHGDARISSDRQDVGHRNLSALRRVYLGPGVTFGTWTNWLRNLQPLALAHPDLIPGLLNALEDRPGDPGVIEHLDALRRERNRAAHGDRPQNRDESALRVAELAPHLERALSRAQFLKDVPWLLTVSSAYQPRSRTFDVVTHRVMGDHPDFEAQTFTWAEPVADDMFYVLGPEGPRALSPFVASRFCSHCRQVEVCYAYRADRNQGPATFKSFDSGHDIPARELGDEIRALPNDEPLGRTQ
jgi:hypothetical protein